MEELNRTLDNYYILADLVSQAEGDYEESKKDESYALGPEDEDYDLQMIEADKLIAKVLHSDLDNTICIGSPVADNRLGEDPEFLNIFGDLFVNEEGEHDFEGFEVNWDLGKSFTEVHHPYDYAEYYLFDLKGIPVVMVYGTDGPYIYLTKEGLRRLRSQS